MRLSWKQSRTYVEYLLFFAFFVFYAYFQHHYWLELPSMSLFEQIEMAGYYLDGGFNLSHLFSAYSEHGMLATNLMFLLNVELFNMTTTFDIVVNVIIVAVYGWVCFKMIRDSFESDQKDFCYYFTIAVCGFFAFNIVQGSCSGMDMQVRFGLLAGLFTSIAFDRLLRADNKLKHVALFSLMTLLYINVFGTLYCMATTAVFLVVLVLRVIAEKKWSKAAAVVVVSLACWGLYFIEYPTAMVSTDVALSSESAPLTLKAVFDTLVFYFRSLLVYSGSFVLGYDTIVDGRIPTDLYMVVGFLILELILWTAVRFFVNKQYEKTWMPLMLIGYSYAVFCMLLLGRNDLGVEWYASTWYHVHTKAAVIGMLWIFLTDAKRNKSVYSGLCMAVCAVMLCGGIFGATVTGARVPYVRIYLENKQPFLYVVDAEDMPVDENGMTPLDHNLDMTMKCLEILREHELSVFSDPENAEKEYVAPIEMLAAGEYYCVQGVWEDGWATDLFEVAVNTGTFDKLTMRGFYPFEITGQEIITVTVGDTIVEYPIQSPDLEIAIDVPVNETVSVVVSSNFSFTNQPDVRKLCFIFQGFDEACAFGE